VYARLGISPRVALVRYVVEGGLLSQPAGDATDT
jgi:hypothetical protein